MIGNLIVEMLSHLCEFANRRERDGIEFGDNSAASNNLMGVGRVCGKPWKKSTEKRGKSFRSDSSWLWWGQGNVLPWDCWSRKQVGSPRSSGVKAILAGMKSLDSYSSGLSHSVENLNWFPHSHTSDPIDFPSLSLRFAPVWLVGQPTVDERSERKEAGNVGSAAWVAGKRRERFGSSEGIAEVLEERFVPQWMTLWLDKLHIEDCDKL